MIEIPPNARTRDAYRAAHEARAEAMKSFFRRFTGKANSH